MRNELTLLKWPTIGVIGYFNSDGNSEKYFIKTKWTQRKRVGINKFYRI